MRNITYSYLLIAFITLTGCANKEPKQLVILGSVHFPTAQVNKDSIYLAIKKVQPQVILLERDSISFDANFKRKEIYKENEDQAVSMYLEEHPETLLRPMEFEGRNDYRIENGLFPQANAVYLKLNQLSQSNVFNADENRIWNRFAHFWIKLDSLSKSDLKTINNKNSDAIVDSAKHYQYTQMLNIVNHHDEFSEKILDAQKDSISLAKYFKKWEQFEHYDRNDAMVTNIIKTIEAMPNKRFMLIVGFNHRYYIKKELEKRAPNINIMEAFK